MKSFKHWKFDGGEEKEREREGARASEEEMKTNGARNDCVADRILNVQLLITHFSWSVSWSIGTPIVILIIIMEIKKQTKHSLAVGSEFMDREKERCVCVVCAHVSRWVSAIGWLADGNVLKMCHHINGSRDNGTKKVNYHVQSWGQRWAKKKQKKKRLRAKCNDPCRARACVLVCLCVCCSRAVR